MVQERRRLAVPAVLSLAMLAVVAVLLRDDARRTDERAAPLGAAAPRTAQHSADPASERAAARDVQPTPLAPPPVAAPADAAPARPDGFETMTVSGRVLGLDGRPAAGADVLLLPDGRTARADGTASEGYRFDRIDLAALPSTRTDAAGRFAIEGPWLPDGGERRAHADPVFPAVMVRAQGATLHVFPCLGFSGGAHDLGDLRLDREGARLVARFVDAAGAPLAGVTLRVQGHRFAELRDEPAFPLGMGYPMLPVQSDVTGRLEVAHLWPTILNGYFRLAGHDGHRLDDLELTSGSTTDLGTLVLGPEAGPRITGLVLDDEGAPLAGARVVARGTGAWARKPDDPADADLLGAFAQDSDAGVLTDAQGRYELRELMTYWDEHLLAVTADGFEPAVLHDVRFDSEAPTVQLRRAAQLHVVARAAEDGRPLPDAVVLAARATGRWGAQHPEPVPEVVPLPVDGLRVDRAGPRGTHLLVDAPGRQQTFVRVEGLATGEQREVLVDLPPAQPFALAFVDERGEPVPEVPFTLRPPLEWGTGFFLESDAGGIEARADEAGRYERPGLAPGRWWLSVRPPAHEGFYGEDCEVPAAGGDVTFRLARTATLHGVLLQLDGSPAVAARVSASTPVPGPAGRVAMRSHDVLTDVQGRWRIHRLPDAPVTLSAESVAPRELHLERGEEREIELRQGAPFRLEGAVSAGGAPLEGARVAVARAAAGLRAQVRTETDASGRYAIEVPTVGEVQVTVSHGAALPGRHALTARLGGREIVDFDLGAAFVGGVVDPGPFERRLDEVVVALVHGERFDVSVNPDPDGRFRLGPLPAGTYSVQLEGGDWRSETVGPFEFGATQTRDDLRFTLRPAAALHGSLTWEDGRPYGGVVHLRDRDGRGDYEVDYCWNGTYDFEGLGPGTWQLDLADTVEKALGEGTEGTPGLGEPGAELPFLAREIVTLAPGERRELDIVIPGTPPK